MISIPQDVTFCDKVHSVNMIRSETKWEGVSQPFAVLRNIWESHSKKSEQLSPNFLIEVRIEMCVNKDLV